MSGMHVVLYGNPVDGLQVIGPFKTEEDAAEWADFVFNGSDCWTVPLEAQDDIE
jgi:hypothetical protein